MPQTKTEQLRFRITSAQREQLSRLAERQGKDATISDVLRGLISMAEEFGGKVPSLKNDIQQKVDKLCAETERPADQVISDCISGIWDLIETGNPPLVVEEIKLRRRYRKESTVPAARRKLVRSR